MRNAQEGGLKMLIEIDDRQLERLLQCKKTKKRGFYDWNISSLINEAILEFYEKYKG